MDSRPIPFNRARSPPARGVSPGVGLSRVSSSDRRSSTAEQDLEPIQLVDDLRLQTHGQGSAVACAELLQLLTPMLGLLSPSRRMRDVGAVATSGGESDLVQHAIRSWKWAQNLGSELTAGELPVNLTLDFKHADVSGHPTRLRFDRARGFEATGTAASAEA